MEALLEAKLEAVLDKVLAEAIDRALVNAIDRVISKTLGVDPEPTTEPKAKGKAKRGKATEPAPTAEPAPKAKKGKATEPAAPAPTAPAPKAEDETEAKLLARLEGLAASLGEKFGPMLMRRARALARHALNPTGALAVMVAWAEKAPAEEIVAVLRGSERLPDGTTLSGWRLMAARLGIPVKE